MGVDCACCALVRKIPENYSSLARPGFRCRLEQWVAVLFSLARLGVLPSVLIHCVGISPHLW